MNQEFDTRTLEHQEQFQNMHNIESSIQRKDYVLGIFLEENSPKKNLYISYHGKYLRCKEFSIGLKINQEIVFIDSSLKNLAEIDEFVFVVLNRYCAFLKIRRKGESNVRYYSTAGMVYKLSLLSIRVLCEDEKSYIFSLFKFMENHVQLFTSQTEGVSLAEETQISRIATILIDGMLEEKRQR